MSGVKLEVYKIRCIEILIYLIYPHAIVNMFVICPRKSTIKFRTDPYGSQFQSARKCFVRLIEKLCAAICRPLSIKRIQTPAHLISPADIL